MSGHRTTSRLDRLDQLQGLLKARDSVVLADLAAELGVSLRTIARDIALLRDRGVPVEGDRGRGGGLRMERSWSIGRLHLTPAEAIDALLALAIAEAMQSPLLLSSIGSIRRKIAAAFPRGEESRIRLLRRRILVGQPASAAVMSTYGAPMPVLLPAIASAFFRLRVLSIRYEDGSGTITERDVEPHFLFLNAPVWYLLCRDRLRNDIRFFRIDRIRAATETGLGFRPGNRDVFMAGADTAASQL